MSESNSSEVVCLSDGEDDEGDEEEELFTNGNNHESKRPWAGSGFIIKNISLKGGESSANEEITNGHSKATNGNDHSSSSSESEDEDDDDGEDGDTEADKIDEELKKAVDKALGNGAIHNSDDEDLDDEQMFKYDEALAAAFKIKKNIKIQQNDVLHYRSKVLDLINEVFKSTQRLDLIVVSGRFLLLLDELYRFFKLSFNLSIQFSRC